MAVPKRDIRGLQQIRTLSGSVDRTVIPYKAYMKLSALEMEKARRGIERKSAEKRIKEIDVRLEKIDVEKASILRVLDDLDNDSTGGQTPGWKTKSSGGGGEGGFTVQY